jgi:hypothetical protein
VRSPDGDARMLADPGCFDRRVALTAACRHGPGPLHGGRD